MSREAIEVGAVSDNARLIARNTARALAVPK
jgi:hypothetical protein